MSCFLGSTWPRLFHHRVSPSQASVFFMLIRPKAAIFAIRMFRPPRWSFSYLLIMSTLIHLLAARNIRDLQNSWFDDDEDSSPARESAPLSLSSCQALIRPRACQSQRVVRGCPAECATLLPSAKASFLHSGSEDPIGGFVYFIKTLQGVTVVGKVNGLLQPGPHDVFIGTAGHQDPTNPCRDVELPNSDPTKTNEIADSSKTHVGRIKVDLYGNADFLILDETDILFQDDLVVEPSVLIIMAADQDDAPTIGKSEESFICTAITMIE